MGLGNGNFELRCYLGPLMGGDVGGKRFYCKNVIHDQDASEDKAYELFQD